MCTETACNDASLTEGILPHPSNLPSLPPAKSLPQLLTGYVALLDHRITWRPAGGTRPQPLVDNHTRQSSATVVWHGVQRSLGAIRESDYPGNGSREAGCTGAGAFNGWG